ncbi:MAG: SDR family NAD(P)-dependent oxidoreductase [Bacteroidetes bacterium]|nr:SDR family NAD(P)-dependent oxidoreductase [Bacteroidota bacterium]
MPIALITGATAGIGKACAYKFAQHGYDLIITGRRIDRLEAVASDIRTNFDNRIMTLNFDVRHQKEVEEAINSLSFNFKEIDILINSAGLASGLSNIQDGDIADWDKMIDTNVKGLLYVSRAVMPLMIKRKHGHIINLGSIAGKETYAKGNVYCATKYAVDSISKAMRIDLLPHHIKVTNITPGAVETEFSLVRFSGDAAKAKSVYAGYEPLTADDIADTIFFAASRPVNVVINDIVITPLAQANTAYLMRSTT